MIHTPRLKKLIPPDTTTKRTNKLPVYYLNKNTSEEFVDQYIVCTIDWCRENFGKPKGKRPLVYWSWDSMTRDRRTGEFTYEYWMGAYLYNDEEILLRTKGLRNIYNLTFVIIHEYVHHLQPKKGNWYKRWNNSLGYENNPYEVEANYIAGLYYVKCTHDVLSILFEDKCF